MTYRVDYQKILSDIGMGLWMARRESENLTYSRDTTIRQAYRDGWTLQSLADATGLTRQRIQQIVTERGER